jgi:Domain of unknown function (DUF6531)
MPKAARRLVMLAVGLTISGAIVIAGPLSSGGLFLTLPTAGEQEAVTLPWLEPHHRGGIDFATGLYVRADQDLIVRGGDLPLVLQRTYRTEDSVSRAFGLGATHNGEWYLTGDGRRFQWAQLILDDGSPVTYHRISWGSSFFNAMFEHTESPTVFYKSRLGWTGSRWALRWFDGSVAIFRACNPKGNDRCGIVELRSPTGLTVRYIRDRATQTLHAIRSGQAEIEFHYDGHHRVSESNGVVRRYTYDSRGAMLTIDEPRWHIENTYDADGRCIHQVTRWPNGEKATLDVAYKVEKDGITETTTSWNDGSKTVYHFDDDHYVASKEFDPTGPAPVVILYRRNAGSNFPTGFSIRCYDAGKRLLRMKDGEYRGEEPTDAMAASTCREWAELTRPPAADPPEPPAPHSQPPTPGVLPRRVI